MEVKVPDIGDFKSVDVIEVLVKPGDVVKAEDALITLETDKATMEVPAPQAGTVRELKVKVGDKVSEGSVIVLLDAVAVATASAAVPPPVTPPAPPAAPVASPPAPAPAAPAAVAATLSAPLDPRVQASSALAHAGPAARRFARELGVDLAKVKGSGRNGRIVVDDIKAHVKTEMTRPQPQGGSLPFNLPPMPVVDFSKFGPVETVPLSRIRRLSGANLHRNWVSIPHVTQHDEADITELEEFRKGSAEDAKKQGVRLTMLAFLMKASVVALKAFPDFNASLTPDGEGLVRKQYFHLGVAVDTPDGLVVPVIRDVDKKGVYQLARELGDLSARAREKKIGPAEMQGGTFSISSLGGIGGTAFTPIINAPEVAILGVSRSQMRPVYRDGQFVPRLILPLSLSYDHRVVDGASGARFITHLCTVLADIRKLVL